MDQALLELERDAYWRGDDTVADLAAQLIDAQQEFEEREKESDEERDRADKAEVALSELKEQMKIALDDILNELIAAQRCGNRAAIERAIQNAMASL